MFYVYFFLMCIFTYRWRQHLSPPLACIRKHELAAVFIGHWQGAKEVVKSFSTTHFRFERVEFAYAYTGHTETEIWLRNNILHLYLRKNFGVPFTAPLKHESHSLLRFRSYAALVAADDCGGWASEYASSGRWVWCRWRNVWKGVILKGNVQLSLKKSRCISCDMGTKSCTSHDMGMWGAQFSVA